MRHCRKLRRKQIALTTFLSGMMASMGRTGWAAVLGIQLSLVLTGGCREGSSHKADAGARDAGGDASVWGPHASPPLADLVREAVAKGPAPSPPEPYKTPSPVTVSPPPAIDVSWLPRDEKGRPMLLDDGVFRYLVVDKRDPVSGMAGCTRMLSRCPEPPDVASGRTIDACWASARACATDQPWTEAAACCPPTCAELYRQLRLLGYGDLAANRRTVESMCFNGLREQLAMGAP
jgi:hypothetical protein